MLPSQEETMRTESDKHINLTAELPIQVEVLPDSANLQMLAEFSSNVSSNEINLDQVDPRRLDLGIAQAQKKPEKEATMSRSWGWLYEWTALGGEKPVLLLEKKLGRVDVSRKQSRLLLPKPTMENILELLNDEQRALIENGTRGLSVMVLDGIGTKWWLKLKSWSTTDVLYGKDWNHIVELNRLDDGEVWIELWGFNCENDEKFCFIILDSKGNKLK